MIPSEGFNDAAKWFRPDVYPAEAQRNGQQGRVRAMIVVNRRGKADKCQILESSGAPLLDSRTCSVALNEARFIADPTAPEKRFLYLPVRWVLPEN